MTEHALIRLRERFFPDATAEDLQGYVARILAGEGLLLRRTERGSRYLLTDAGQDMVFVMKSGRCVTVQRRARDPVRVRVKNALKGAKMKPKKPFRKRALYGR